MRPVLGRTFTRQEDSPSSPRVVVISYALWQRRFGGSPDVLGQTMRVNSADYTIIGVMPRGFNYPYRGTELWAPVQEVLSRAVALNRSSHQFYVVARLRKGVSQRQAQAEINGIAQRIKAEYPAVITGSGADVFSLKEYTIRGSRRTVLLLFAAVGCVLLISCVNMANLLLVRESRRSHEIAIRTALGAGRGRLIRQFLTESILISAVGAAAGLVIAYALTRVLAAHSSLLLSQGDIDTSGAIQLDARVFLFTAVLCLLVGAAIGLFPALQTAKIQLTNALKEGARSVSGVRSQHYFRRTLVTIEVALSLVLLIAAGLLVRSFVRLQNVAPGIRTNHLLTAGLSLPQSRYRTPVQVANFEKALITNLQNVPGVRKVGLVSCLPLGGYCGDQAFQIEGRPMPPGQALLALLRGASPDYFSAAGIPLIRGRVFTREDSMPGGPSSPSRNIPVIISHTMKEKFWPSSDPIGKRIFFEGDSQKYGYTIIGIVGDVRISLDEKPQATMYLPLLNGMRNKFFIVLNTAGTTNIGFDIRHAIQRIDPDLPLFGIRSVGNLLAASSARQQFTVNLLGLFSIVALILAAVGLYGVLSFTVAQRTKEIGLRMALGASPANIRRLVIFDGMRPSLLGIAIGLIGSIGANRVLESFLFDTSPWDPLTFLSVSAILSFVAILACYLPAVRATRIDPATLLRVE
ncbi:MAG: ABC transporter permease [Bryobacteraceae bacterium]